MRRRDLTDAGRPDRERPDGELVALARDGNRQAMDELLTRHHARLSAVCRRIVGSDDDAADATQEAMIAVVRGLAHFDGRSSVSTWMYRIATNASLDELRRRHRRPLLERAHTDGDGDHRQSVEPAGRSPRIDGLADAIVLDEALRSLPDDFRAAVVLRDVADLDYAEIAEILQIPPGTVRSRIARGRAALARSLGNPETLDGRPTPDTSDAAGTDPATPSP